MAGAKPATTDGHRVDWPALLKRVEHSFESADDRLNASPEQTQDILKARAAELAALPAREPECVRRACLEFLLSGERYAVELGFISQTLPLAEFTPLFCTPAFVLGITNLRGRIVSIIDLRRFFELPEVGLSDLNRVIVVSDGKLEVGILADSIVGVVTVADRDLNPPPAACTGTREEFLAGVTADRLALLDLGRILADRRIVVHEEVG